MSTCDELPPILSAKEGSMNFAKIPFPQLCSPRLPWKHRCAVGPLAMVRLVHPAHVGHGMENERNELAPCYLYMQENQWCHHNDGTSNGGITMTGPPFPCADGC